MSERHDETAIPAPKAGPGMRAVDDHVAGGPAGGGHQPTAGLERGVETEHLASPSQGARIEPAGAGPGPGAEASGGGPSGAEDEDRGGDGGPAFDAG